LSKEELEKLSKEEKLELVNKGYLFCTRRLTTGLVKKFVNFIFETILSPEFIVFACFSIAFFSEDKKENIHWVVYGIISFIFIVARALRTLIGDKTTVNVNANATVGATAALNVVGDLNKAVQQLKDKVE